LHLENDSFDSITYLEINLPSSTIDTLNIFTDESNLVDNDDVLYIYQPSLGAADIDSSGITFFGGLSPENFNINQESRAFNPEIDTLWYSLGEENNLSRSSENDIQVKINALFGEDEIIISDPKVSNDLYYIDPDSLATLLDGLYKLSASVTSGDTSSIDLYKIFQLDRNSPFIDQLDLYSGSTPDGSGHNILKGDSIKFTFSDSLNYFDEGYTYQISSQDTFHQDLNYLFSNEIFLTINTYINGNESITNYLDTLLIDEEYTANYPMNISSIVSADHEDGDLLIILSLLDPSGNISIDSLIYSLVSASSALSELEFFNYPNPFSTASGEKTTFRYNLPESHKSGNMIIYDNAGYMVYHRKLDEADLTALTHEISWDGKTNNGYYLDTGVYYAILDFADRKPSRINKIVVINR